MEIKIVRVIIVQKLYSKFLNPKNYKSKLFKSIEFEELTNSKELFRENHQIVNPLYLNYMNDLDMEYRIYNI